MRVLMIEYFLPSSTYSLELASSLSEKCELTLLCKENYVAPLKSGLDIRPLLHFHSNGKIDGLLKSLQDLRLVRKTIDEMQPDVVHVQGFCHPCLEIPFFCRLRLRSRWKLAYTVHNAFSHEPKKGERNYLSSWYKHCDLLFVHNKATVEQLPVWLRDDEKIVVAPHGCYEIENIAPRIKREVPVVFLSFGLLRRYKGLDIVIEALSLLDPEVRDRVKLVIAGNQKESYDSFDYLEYARELRVEDRIDFNIRFIDENEVPNYFNNADYCVFAYRSITGSGALSMAFTFERPVVASGLPTFVEECEGAAVFFKPEDAPDLASALEQCVEMSDGEYERLRVGACAAKAQHSWKRSSTIVAEAYDHVVAMPRKSEFYDGN